MDINDVKIGQRWFLKNPHIYIFGNQNIQKNNQVLIRSDSGVIYKSNISNIILLNN